MDYSATVAIADNVAKEAMPMDMIFVRTGVVVKQVQLIDNTINGLPCMIGWDKDKISNWVNLYEGPKHMTLRLFKREV